jgi:RND superfamily putative drug exporter
MGEEAKRRRGEGSPFRLLAQVAVRRPWAVICFWAAVGLLASVEAPTAVERLTAEDDAPEGSESAAADSLLRTRFASPLSDVLVVTLETPAPLDSTGPGQVLDSLIAGFAARPWVDRVISWRSTDDSSFVRADRRGTVLFVALTGTAADTALSLVAPARAIARRVFTALSADSSYRVLVTGEIALNADLRTVSERASRESEIRLAPVTLLVLIAAFGALVAAVLPLIVGFFAIWVALAAIALLARVTPMSIYVMNITTMLGLAVGIDYSLLVVNRFREELAHADPATAAVRATETAGAAAFTSGLTVLVGFAALLLTPIVETRSLGVGGVIVVTVAVALSLTLVPALLAVLGNRIDEPRWLTRRLAPFRGPRLWQRWGAWIMAHPALALGVGLLIVGTLTLPVRQMRVGLPARNWWPRGTESVEGLESLERLGMGAAGQPIRVLVELPEGRNVTAAVALRGLRRMGDSLEADPRVRLVRSVADPGKVRSIFALSMLYADLDAAREEFPDFVDAYLSTDGRMALVDVVLRDTVSLTSGMDAVAMVRRLGSASFRGLEGATVTVGGFFANMADLQNLVMAQFPLIVGLVLSATAVMLAAAFRSVLVPIKAVVLNLLSVGASFGLIVTVFQLGRGSAALGLGGPSEAIFALIPVLVFAIVFGLSMDYEVFLLSRVKEAYDLTGKNDQAVADGLTASAGTITWAALVMILVFGAFAFTPVFVVKVLGFGLATAVLLDATLIRLVLAPAFMRLAGRWNWWPGEGQRTKGPKD